MAFLGGAYTIDAPTYKYLVGAALLAAACWLLLKPEDTPARAAPRLAIAMPVGAAIGFLAGLTGVGGGIFLSPILLVLHWTNMRTNAAIAAAFILANSIAGLAGYLTVTAAWPSGVPALVAVALVGGLVGSELAIRRLAPARLRTLLGVVLVVAGIKMLLTAQLV
jgi:uncharacterized membrane protein YfcA